MEQQMDRSKNQVGKYPPIEGLTTADVI
jgi:hypothetical protein